MLTPCLVFSLPTMVRSRITTWPEVAPTMLLASSLLQLSAAMMLNPPPSRVTPPGTVTTASFRGRPASSLVTVISPVRAITSPGWAAVRASFSSWAEPAW